VLDPESPPEESPEDALPLEPESEPVLPVAGGSEEVDGGGTRLYSKATSRRTGVAQRFVVFKVARYFTVLALVGDENV